MKTQGLPVRVPSPWIEKNTSLTVSIRSFVVDGAAAGGLPDPHAAQLRPLRPQPLPHFLEEVAGHGFRGWALPGEGGMSVDVLVVEAGRHLAHRPFQVLEVHHHADPVQTLSRRHRLHHKDINARSEEHTSELQSPDHLVCRLLLEKKKKQLTI